MDFAKEIEKVKTELTKDSTTTANMSYCTAHSSYYPYGHRCPYCDPPRCPGCGRPLHYPWRYPWGWGDWWWCDNKPVITYGTLQAVPC